jgi:hypothetical protein
MCGFRWRFGGRLKGRTVTADLRGVMCTSRNLAFLGWRLDWTGGDFIDLFLNTHVEFFGE